LQANIKSSRIYTSRSVDNEPSICIQQVDIQVIGQLLVVIQINPQVIHNSKGYRSISSSNEPLAARVVIFSSNKSNSS
jgi:hypothetical protein